MEFIEFWTDMSWTVITLICLAVEFAIGEFFIRGFGTCKLLSILCATLAIVGEGICTKSVIYVFYLMIFLAILALLIYSGFLLFLKFKDKKNNTVDECKNCIAINSKNILVGRVGEVVEDCEPIGKADFEGGVYTVISKNKGIEKGALIFVQEIKDDLIYVKEFNENE